MFRVCVHRYVGATRRRSACSASRGAFRYPLPRPELPGPAGDCPICFGSGTSHDELGEFSTERPDDSHPALAPTRTAASDRNDEQKPVLYDGLPDEIALGACSRHLLDPSRDRR